MIMNKERRIKSTNLGAQVYGSCERCGKHCSLHYKQQSKSIGGWITAGFGHVECLKKGKFKDAEVIE
tara:strand:+ start:190 stop:390 length:201 start_codon:yes stop_codon:yes gene_type:complete